MQSHTVVQPEMSEAVSDEIKLYKAAVKLTSPQFGFFFVLAPLRIEKLLWVGLWVESVKPLR